jgi:hypothetical protein
MSIVIPLSSAGVPPAFFAFDVVAAACFFRRAQLTLVLPL